MTDQIVETATNNSEHIKMLIGNIEAMQVQLWVTTTGLSILVVLVGYFGSTMINDMKTFMSDTRETLGDHNADIQVLKSQQDLGHHIGNHFKEAAATISGAIDRKTERIRQR